MTAASDRTWIVPGESLWEGNGGYRVVLTWASAAKWGLEGRRGDGMSRWEAMYDLKIAAISPTNYLKDFPPDTQTSLLEALAGRRGPMDVPSWPAAQKVMALCVGGLESVEAVEQRDIRRRLRDELKVKEIDRVLGFLQGPHLSGKPLRTSPGAAAREASQSARGCHFRRSY